MKDEIIEEREKKNKSNVSDSISFIELREQYKVSLRKKKINEILSVKRNIKNINKSEFEPIINLDKINPQLKSNNNLDPKSQILFFLDILNDYRKIDINIYYIFNKINDNLSQLKNNPKEIIEIELTEKLIYFISEFQYKDKSLIYLFFKIFLNISTIPNQNLMESFITINFLQIIYDILIELYKNSNDYYEIIEIILLFLGNFLEDNSFIQSSLYKYRIFSLIFDFIEKNKDTNSFSYYNILSKSIGFFVCFSSVNPPQNQNEQVDYFQIIDYECIQKLYLIFSHFLFISNNKDSILDCIWGLSFLPHYNCEIIISNYFKDNIFNKLYELAYLNNYYMIPIIRTLGNVTSLNDEFCIKICDDNLSNFIISNLQSEFIPSQVKIEILWVLSNLCLGTNMNCLFKYNLLEVILNVINNEQNKIVIIEALKVLLICLNNSVSINILCDSIVDIVGRFIHKYEDIEIIMILAIICEIIFNNPNQNFIYKLINYGIREILDKWALNDNEELRESANKMLNNKYFIN